MEMEKSQRTTYPSHAYEGLGRRERKRTFFQDDCSKSPMSPHLHSLPDRWLREPEICEKWGGPGLLDRLAAKLRCLPVSDHAAKFLLITSCCCC